MKKCLSFALALLLLLLTVLGMTACKQNPPDEEVPQVPEGPMVDIVTDGQTEWRLIRSETATADSAEVQAAMALRVAIREATGCNIAFTTDYEDDDNGRMYEILVGDTVRAEDEGLGELQADEYVIAFVGNKLIIKGGSDAAMTRAMTFFIDTYVGDGSAKTDLRVPEGLHMADSYWMLMTEDELNIFNLSAEDYALLEDLAYSSTIDPSNADVKYQCHEDGGVIYNPISQEKADQLDKYDDSEKLTGTLQTTVNGVTYTLDWDIPEEFTAYDAVPIHYTLTASGSSSEKIYISATSFDDPTRENEELYYDLNVPGTFDLDWEYLGHVYADEDISNRAPVASDGYTTETASQYPQYNDSDLEYSGSVRQSEMLYFNFRYTNTGNTILDGNGNGGFAVYPALYRKDEYGSWQFYQETGNGNMRIFDEVYPGEGGEFYFAFYDVEPGEYKLVIHGRYRFEHSFSEVYGLSDDYVWDEATTSEYYFEVVKEDTWTDPQKIIKSNRGRWSRNGWLHSYEEFMSSYNTHLQGISAGETLEETMYLQAPPWGEQVVLRLIIGEGDNMDAVAIPVEVETDSITIDFNSDNDNYVVLEDGTRFSAIMTQTMADMRINVKLSPYADQDIINNILTMQEVGINVLQTTSAFTIDGGGGTGREDGIDAFWFVLDVARLLGIEVQGWIGYPYHDPTIVNKVNGLLDAGLNPVGEDDIPEAQGIAANWQYMRWGDNYWISGENTLPLDLEDTRGWLRRGFNGRYIATDTSKQNFRYFLADLYDRDIDALNSEWGTDYTCFDEIDPEEGTTGAYDGINWRNYQSDDIVFSEWSRPLELWDQFRTLERISEYQRILDVVREVMPTASIALRTEGNNWLAIVDPETGNSHYRHIFYDQRENAVVPELLANAGIISNHTDYNTIPYTPSEVAELTRSSVELGITPCIMPMADWMRDLFICENYGFDNKYSYNLDDETTVAEIRTCVSVFEWWKATYENGGIPGILWQDYPGQGVVTSAQRKEMAFFTEKLTEALNTPEGQEWATNFTQDESVLEGSDGLFSYDKEFVQDAIDEAKENRKYY